MTRSVYHELTDKGCSPFIRVSQAGSAMKTETGGHCCDALGQGATQDVSLGLPVPTLLLVGPRPSSSHSASVWACSDCCLLVPVQVGLTVHPGSALITLEIQLEDGSSVDLGEVRAMQEFLDSIELGGILPASVRKHMTGVEVRAAS